MEIMICSVHVTHTLMATIKVTYSCDHAWLLCILEITSWNGWETTEIYKQMAFNLLNTSLNMILFGKIEFAMLIFKCRI